MNCLASEISDLDLLNIELNKNNNQMKQMLEEYSTEYRWAHNFKKLNQYRNTLIKELYDCYLKQIRNVR